MAELGAGAGTSYPASLDTDAVVETDGSTYARADVPNDLSAAIIAIQTELGTDPAGTLANVKTFLQTEHNTDGTHPIVLLEEHNTDGTHIVDITAEHNTDGTHSTVTADEVITDYGFFYDRGDPASVDFTVGSFVTDGTWRDLDLSSIVPADAKAVLLRVDVIDNVVASYFEMRKNGNANAINVAIVQTIVANMHHYENFIVKCDSNRVIEYNGSNVAFTGIDVTVRGWWK